GGRVRVRDGGGGKRRKRSASPEMDPLALGEESTVLGMSSERVIGRGIAAGGIITRNDDATAAGGKRGRGKGGWEAQDTRRDSREGEEDKWSSGKDQDLPLGKTNGNTNINADAESNITNTSLKTAQGKGGSSGG
ncbi:unnamed protein product, partial [Discosporangium mesarthrocarpum]